MSAGTPPTDPDPDGLPEDELLAAEYALRILDPEAMLAARGRAANDPAFAAAVAAWNARLVPMLDEAAPEPPPPAMWSRIAAAIAAGRTGGTNVVALHAKLRFWRLAAAGLTAAAAMQIVALGFFSGRDAARPAAPVAAAEGTRVAALAPEASPNAALAVISYDPAGRSLVVTPAALTPAAGRDYELWVIPADGRPRSLGVVGAGPPRRVLLADDLAAAFAGAPTLAVSQEREGGSRTGQPQGPIVASGALSRV